MTIRIFNTLTGQKDVFKPIKPNALSMYVCGPTVYDSCHIGHARSVVVFDVIVRYFEISGFDVTYVRNFTDIDDKIIDRADQLNITPKALAETYIDAFYRDMDALNVKRATVEPKATDHIDQIIRIIEQLLDKKAAYRSGGDVFYAVESFPSYGKLSGRKPEEMKAGARVDIDDRKHNPFDFVLWKAAKPNEPAWDSPWGKGRPGWHIECSAMSAAYLGQPFDIHGGGKDLVFPHHENEIAQSERAWGKPFANYWIHNGFVNIDQEKMSKSLGNFMVINDVLKHRHPEALRLFLLSNHYRSPIDFTQQAMTDAEAGLDRLYTLYDRMEKQDVRLFQDKKAETGEQWKRFCEAMDDDFNTARGLGILFDLVRYVNRLLDDHGDPLSEAVGRQIATAKADMDRIGSVLGLLSDSPQRYFNYQKSIMLSAKGMDSAEIDRLIQQRSDARRAKDWEKADQIRNKLKEMNISLEDRSEGTIWKVMQDT